MKRQWNKAPTKLINELYMNMGHAFMQRGTMEIPV